MSDTNPHRSSQAPKAERVEGWVQALILLVMGGMAGAASFTHVHNLTVEHGQPSWFGWVNAVVVELTSIAAGLEIRRRRRTGQPVAVIVAVLVVAVGTSLAAQVALAQPSVWGWIVAALPALGFLTSIKIVLARTEPVQPRPVPTDLEPPAPRVIDPDPASAQPATEESGLDSPEHVDLANEEPSKSTQDRTGASPGTAPRVDRPIGRSTQHSGKVAPPTSPSSRSEHGLRPVTGAAARLPEPLLAAARSIADEFTAEGRRLSRSTLITALRDRGHRVGTDRATALLRHLSATRAPRTPRWVGRAAQQSATRISNTA